jgi:hypothetical protein
MSVDISISGMQKQVEKLRIKFIAKLGAMGKYQDGEKKFHIIIPRKYIDQIRELEDEHIRVEIDNEI